MPMTIPQNTKYLIDKLFSLLDDWRNLPAYQLERRADIFFALYLEKIVQSKFGDTIDFIIPEFPLRLGTLSEGGTNQSCKIDYIAVCEQVSKVYFIELKTDQTSRRGAQDEYLLKARQVNITGLIDGIIKIIGATKQKAKYKNLAAQLEKIGWTCMDGKVCKNTSKDYTIEVVYIQPLNENGDVDIISFQDVISALSDQGDDLTRRFIQSLERWKRSPGVGIFPNNYYEQTHSD
jgi:hypothetical protein